MGALGLAAVMVVASLPGLAAATTFIGPVLVSGAMPAFADASRYSVSRVYKADQICQRGVRALGDVPPSWRDDVR
jgi:uncharacterized protein (DUF934 family)